MEKRSRKEVASLEDIASVDNLLTDTCGIDVDSGRVECVTSLTHSCSTRHCSTSSRARCAVCSATC